MEMRRDLGNWTNSKTANAWCVRPQSRSRVWNTLVASTEIWCQSPACARHKNRYWLSQSWHNLICLDVFKLFLRKPLMSSTKIDRSPAEVRRCCCKAMWAPELIPVLPQHHARRLRVLAHRPTTSEEKALHSVMSRKNNVEWIVKA